MTSPTDRIHVVHVIGSFQTGGAEKMLVNFLGAVNKEKFKHTVLCLTRRGELADDLRQVDVEVQVFRVRIRTLPRDLRRLAGWFRDHRADVVHSHMFYASLWARTAALWAGVPVLITTEHSQEHWKKWWQVRADRFLSGKTFHHIAVSQDVRNIRLERDGVAPGQITMIPNGVPIPEVTGDPEVRQKVRAKFGLPLDVPVVGTVGRMIDVKGYPFMLQALALARKSYPSLHWLQVGDGPDRKKIIALAEEMGLSEAVTFAGKRSDVSSLLEAMDIWAMSSTHEGLPVALLEAMAAGRTIVATNVGGIPDVVDHEVSAILVAPQDARELAAGLVRVLDDHSLAQKLAAGARVKVEMEYGIEAVARRIEGIYLEGLAART